MMQVSAKLRRADNGFMHWCPACEEMHPLPDGWKFDGDLEKPTFRPSFAHSGVVIKNGEWTGDWVYANGKPVPWRCHYILTAGILNFQNDCTHALAGKAVPLPDLPDGLTDKALETGHYQTSTAAVQDTETYTDPQPPSDGSKREPRPPLKPFFQRERLSIILSWEEPLWVVHGQSGHGCTEASGPSIEEAFATFYNQRQEAPGAEIVTSWDRSEPGMYRIVCEERGDGSVAVHSTDITGLAYEEPSAEDAFLKLPCEVVRLLSEQGAIRSHT